MGLLGSSIVELSQRSAVLLASTPDAKIEPAGSLTVTSSHICRAKAKPVGTLWPAPAWLTTASNDKAPARTPIDERGKSTLAALRRRASRRGRSGSRVATA